MDPLVALLDHARLAVRSAHTAVDVDRVRTSLLGRKGTLTALLSALPTLPPPERRQRGRDLNEAKHEIEGLLHDRAAALTATTQPPIDPTLPGERPERGHLHPLSRYSREMMEVWRSLGYDVHEGPELEEQWYNFEGLNMPPEHPARDIQDTFYLKDHPQLVLRTHCSTVQLRSVLHQKKPPLKYVEIGRSYRHEATDATHEAMFTHCDGIVVDRKLTMAHLVTTLRVFLSRMFPHTKIRIRPGYFPFVEPGIEVDMEWTQNRKTEWLEMLGAGMVHPNVIRAMGFNPREWNGFAFGMGVERQVMIKSGIPDMRFFFNGNLDFLKQF